MHIRQVNKLTILLSVLIFFQTAVSGQETQGFSIPVEEFQKEGLLIFKQVYGSVEVSGQDRDDILVTAHLERRSQEAGLSKVPKLRFRKNNNQVVIENFFPEWRVKWKIIVPSHFDVRVNNVDEGNITVSGIAGQVEVGHVNGSIFLSQLLRSASANTTNGSIHADFDEVEKDCAMAFSTFEGPIKINFPTELNAKITMSTENGKMFSDFRTSENQSQGNQNSKGLGTAKIRNTREIIVGDGEGEIFLTSYNGNLTIKSKTKN